MRTPKIQSKNPINMKIGVEYLNFVFHVELKTKSNNKFLNFVSKTMKWHFGYTNYLGSLNYVRVRITRNLNRRFLELRSCSSNQMKIIMIQNVMIS